MRTCVTSWSIGRGASRTSGFVPRTTMSRHLQFARPEVALETLARRGHQLHAMDCKAWSPPRNPFSHADLVSFLDQVLAARKARRPVILMMGGHPIKLGLSPF